MPGTRDPRAVLGLPDDATRAEAQRAFRRLAKQTHPDAGGNAAAFRTVASAWAELASRLPAARPAAGPTPSPHVRAYQPPASRVVWAESRRPAARRAPDFRTVLDGALARVAA